jgi:hypothetical protein
MIRASSVISPSPLQSDTLDSISKKIRKDIGIGHGFLLANFDDENKIGKVIAIGIVTARVGEHLTVKWTRKSHDIIANSSRARGYWRNSALFDIEGKRANDLDLPALFSSIVATQTKASNAGNLDASEQDNATTDIFEILEDGSLRDTEKRLLVSARIGQGCFREALIKHWKGCAITGLSNPMLLRASHIKPWAASTNQERLNPFNGILLIPNIDLLFDRGFISFDPKGKILISNALDKNELEQMGLEEGAQIDLELEHQVFLAFHRDNVFRG